MSVEAFDRAWDRRPGRPRTIAGVAPFDEALMGTTTSTEVLAGPE